MPDTEHLSPHFTRREIECHCGCGLCDVQSKLLRRLEQIRELIGRPLRVNSVCRCSKHNEEVGGEPNSAHLDGWAADLDVVTSRDRFQVLSATFRVGVTRIGIGKYLIHIDADPTKPPEVVWLY